MGDGYLEDFRKEWKKELSSQNNESLPGKCSENRHQKTEVPSCSGSNEQQHEQANEHGVPSQDSLGSRENCNNIISTCYTQPESCYYSFSIVGKLLNSKNSESKLSGYGQSKTASHCEKRKISTDSNRMRYKKTKFTDLKYIFTERQQAREVMSDERLLDRLIADIDEITEIPFFDISIPREVAINIFQYLGMTDLCHCAQVSKSWQSLAEDELLWCRVCHGLGKETLYTTREQRNWKQIVKHNIQRQRLLVTNWKSRTGELSQLEYVKGNILCAMSSYDDVIVTGYTSGEVKLWDLATDCTCVYQPSSTALIVNEEGTENNIVESVVTSGKITAASYTQGIVDIWSLDSGTMPIQTHTPATRGQHNVPVACLSKGGHSVAIRYGHQLDLLKWDDETKTFALSTTLNNSLKIEHIKFLDTGTESACVIYSDRNIVRLHQSRSVSLSDCDSQISEVHNMIDAPIHVIDCNMDQKVLAVAHGSFLNITDGCMIKLYDIHSGKLLHSLRARALRVTCMNMEESPNNELVIGTGDRKVHIFDTRVSEPVHTYVRHTGGMVCVQMDDWKVVSGAWDGFVCVWDRRMNNLLWDMHNRHPVGYSHYNDKHLVVGNIPSSKFPDDEFESTSHKRYRGSVNCYNFLADLTTKDVPEICLSTYDQPDASKYNISLAVPYDALSF